MKTNVRFETLDKKAGLRFSLFVIISRGSKDHKSYIWRTYMRTLAIITILFIVITKVLY